MTPEAAAGRLEEGGELHRAGPSLGLHRPREGGTLLAQLEHVGGAVTIVRQGDISEVRLSLVLRLLLGPGEEEPVAPPAGVFLTGSRVLINGPASREEVARKIFSRCQGNRCRFNSLVISRYINIYINRRVFFPAGDKKSISLTYPNKK